MSTEIFILLRHAAGQDGFRGLLLCLASAVGRQRICYQFPCADLVGTPWGLSQNFKLFLE